MDTVFFVDDDILTLGRLREIIDWRAHGYEIAGQAMDGEAALEQIRALRPTLVILDINMPRKSGVAVAEALAAQPSAPYILALSNHDAFEYVRQVMRHGAQDYLLKHELTPELLAQKLAELGSLRSRQSLNQQWDRHAAALGRREALRMLLEGKPQEAAPLPHGRPVFAADCLSLILLRIVNFRLFTHFDGDRERERIVEAVRNLAANVLSGMLPYALAPMGDGDFALLLEQDGGLSGAQAQEQARALTAMFAANAQRLLGIRLIAATSPCLAGPDQLRPAYQKLLLQLPEQGAAAPSDIRCERAVMDALAALDPDRTRRALRQMVESQGLDAAEQLLRISRQFMEAHAIRLKDLYLRPFQNRFRVPLEKEQLAEILSEHYDLLLAEALEKALPGQSAPVREAIAYIHAHYARDISLSTAADQVGVSAAHLSRQFHKEIGQPFVDYLTRVRMEAARRLLAQPGSRIKEVCGQVGFTNYNYFLRVFKKTTGLTAKQCADAARSMTNAVPERLRDGVCSEERETCRSGRKRPVSR